MERLIKGTTAYKILSGDRIQGRLSHAYMLHFNDSANLRAALKIFALEFFGAEPGTALYSRILSENYTDLDIYPPEGKKITADGVAEIIADGALRPMEGDKKLFVITDFDSASALVQNKLLKSLEEPMDGVHFLLGATSVSPILDTVRSRVKLLEIPPFTEEEIFKALERISQNPLNGEAAKSAGGCLGAAQSMVSGAWFDEVRRAASEICSTVSVGGVGEVCAKYGETKYKKELLAEMQRLYFSALTEGGALAERIAKPALVYALEKINGANADLKFNAFFQGLLYDFLLGVIEENNKWRKL